MSLCKKFKSVLLLGGWEWKKAFFQYISESNWEHGKCTRVSFNYCSSQFFLWNWQICFKRIWNVPNTTVHSIGIHGRSSVGPRKAKVSAGSCVPTRFKRIWTCYKKLGTQLEMQRICPFFQLFSLLFKTSTSSQHSDRSTRPFFTIFEP